MSRIYLPKEGLEKLKHIISTQSLEIHNNTIILYKTNKKYIDFLRHYFIKDICNIIMDYITENINVNVVSYAYHEFYSYVATMIDLIIYDTVIHDQHCYVVIRIHIECEN